MPKFELVKNTDERPKHLPCHTKLYIYVLLNQCQFCQTTQFTQLVGGKPEQAKMRFPPPRCVTRDCLSTYTSLKYIIFLVSVTGL